MELFNYLDKLCKESGINTEDFLEEIPLILEERKRILFTPNRDWFLKNSNEMREYLSQILGYRPDIHLVRTELERLRLFYSPDLRTSLSRAEKNEILQKQNHRCAICGIPLVLDNVVEDHIKPISLGGLDEFDNKQLTCSECNSGKSDYTNYASICAWRISNSELRKYPEMNLSTRYAVLSRDRNRCKICEKTQYETRLLVTKKTPESLGGQNVYDNLITLCDSCLSERGE